VEVRIAPSRQTPKIEPVVPKRISGLAGSSPWAFAPGPNAAMLVATIADERNSRRFSMAVLLVVVLPR
jgi:hypothetical protein